MKPAAIVTGASSGIGKAAALRLARDFGSLALVARRGDALAEVAQEAMQRGCECLVLEMDLSAERARVNRFGEPEDIAELLAFIVSPGAKYMTGTVLRMDGGETDST